MRKDKKKKYFLYFCFVFRMGILHFAILNVIISLSALLNVAALNDLGYSIEIYDESSGVYYENRGVAVLYNVAWRTIVYVYLNKIDNETLVMRLYVHSVAQKSIGLKFSKSRTGSDVRYSCHHNSSPPLALLLCETTNPLPAPDG
jgi:hypothetical protein